MLRMVVLGSAASCLLWSEMEKEMQRYRRLAQLSRCASATVFWGRVTGSGPLGGGQMENPRGRRLCTVRRAVLQMREERTHIAGPQVIPMTVCPRRYFCSIEKLM
jgi:hypothetical protein